MKLSAFLLVFGLIFSASAKDINKNDINNTGEKNMKIDTYKEYEAIKQVVGTYVEAGLKGKSSLMKPAFHKDATMYGHIDGKLVGGPIEALFNIIDTGEPAKNLKAEIVTVDYIGGIAQVKVEAENWNGARYTDMFILVKDEGEWKILTKVYHTH